MLTNSWRNIVNMEIMLNNQEEIDFLLSNLRPTDTVLEYGAGGSTIEIAKHVKKVYSIESDITWYGKVKAIAPENVEMVYMPRNHEEAPGHDGTLEDYYDYVHIPLSINKKFDVVFIDGRARPHCAKIASTLLKRGGIILIHDYGHPNPVYRRPEYEVVEEFLTKTGQAFALARFKVKK